MKKILMIIMIGVLVLGIVGAVTLSVTNTFKSKDKISSYTLCEKINSGDKVKNKDNKIKVCKDLEKKNYELDTLGIITQNKEEVYKID